MFTVHLSGSDIEKNTFLACGANSDDATFFVGLGEFQKKLNTSTERHHCCEHCTQQLEKYLAIPKKFVLTYTVELKTRPTFTTRKTLPTMERVNECIEKLKMDNKKIGRHKYSGLHLYDSNMKDISSLLQKNL